MSIDIANLFSHLASADPFLIALGIFCVLLLCGFGFPLPEDIVLAFTGYVCHLGILPLWLCILLGMGGVLIGDSTLWWIGHRYGRKVLELRLLRSLLPGPRLLKIERLYGKWGNRMLFGARFSPGIRAGVFLFAGLSGVSYRRFILSDGTAALLSVPLIIVVTYHFGSEIDWVLGAMRGVQHYLVAGLLAIIVGHITYSFVLRRRERRQMEKVVLKSGNGTGTEPEAAAVVLAGQEAPRACELVSSLEPDLADRGAIDMPSTPP